MKLSTSTELSVLPKLLERACRMHEKKLDAEVVRRLELIREISRTTIVTDGEPPVLHSAVLILVSAESVLLTVRAALLRNDPGAVVFPGGKRDPEDLDLRATAIREAFEEVGVRIPEASVIGALPRVCRIDAPLLATITPVVAYVETRPELVLNLNEVASAHELKHADWLGSSVFDAKRLESNGGIVTPEHVPVGDRALRGSTYFIFELLRQSIAEAAKRSHEWHIE